jgi:mannose-6-phosphate isomerase-like protein (cupin superfamily)
MHSVLHAAVRKWIKEEHVKNILKGKWTTMYDSDGKLFKGIRGRIGAASISMYGENIGADLIEMQPGTAFPLHVHDGDHVLYIESGTGAVHVDGKDRKIKKGDTIFIAGEYPHGVVGPRKGAKQPLVIVAFGHPRVPVDSHKRMRHPTKAQIEAHEHSHGHDHAHPHTRTKRKR